MSLWTVPVRLLYERFRYSSLEQLVKSFWQLAVDVVFSKINDREVLEVTDEGWD